MSRGCEAIRDELVAYLDGELDDPREREVVAHLEACAACLEEARALDESFAMLEELAVPEVPAGLEQRVRARVAGTGGAHRADILRFGGPLRSWLAVAAVLVAVAALALVIYRRLPDRGALGPVGAPGGSPMAQGEGPAPSPGPAAQDDDETDGERTPWETPGTGAPGPEAEPDAGTAVAGGVDVTPDPPAPAPELAPEPEQLVEAPGPAPDAPELVSAPREEDRVSPGSATPEAGGLDPELEREAILALDLLEDLELVEAMELLEALEELEDPAWLLSDTGESG